MGAVLDGSRPSAPTIPTGSSVITGAHLRGIQTADSEHSRGQTEREQVATQEEISIEIPSVIVAVCPAGRELWHNGPSVTVDYDTLDPLVRRDSFQETAVLQTGELFILSRLLNSFSVSSSLI